MVQELDTVVLTHDIPEYGLERGDVGAVVHCYKDSFTFEVEFVTADGKTIAVLMLNQTDIRPIIESNISNATSAHSYRITPL
jgi:hypothetical protein